MRLFVMSIESYLAREDRSKDVPGQDHVVVHLLQLLLGDLERVRRRIEFIRLEALFGEIDREGLIFSLEYHITLAGVHTLSMSPYSVLTSGTLVLSVSDDAASVVTARRQLLRRATDLRGKGRLARNTRANMACWLGDE